MKIVTVSTIRNEADIIETFVRYHLQFVDRMIIVNHRSADSSAEILHQLQNEGLPIEIEEDRSVDFQQAFRVTRLMQRAVSDYGADWVIPLDADEFLAAAGDGKARDIIEKLDNDRVVKMSWWTYVPLPSDDPAEPDVLKRVQHCLNAPVPSLHKIMVPRSVAKTKQGMVGMGNHEFKRRRFGRMKEFPWRITDQLSLAHFPVRSSQQIMTKVLVTWLSILAKPNKEPTESFHIKILFDRFLNNEQIPPEELTDMALNYIPGNTRITARDDLVIHKPVRPAREGLALKYGMSHTVNILPALAQMAEELAETVGALRRQSSVDEPSGLARLRRRLRL
jgi:hypothetical protein